MSILEIAGRLVGDGQPPFVIAEIGVNHNGDPAMAARLIDSAAEAGADAVKLQAFRADELVRADAPQAQYQRERAGADSQLSMLRSLELSAAAMRSLAEHAFARGIIFFASPFDVPSVALLDEIGVPVVKIGSGDVTNLVLLRGVAALGRPVILSTGMSELSEVDDAVRELRAAGCVDLVLLQCTSSYPAPIDSANLRVIETLRDRYQVVVGYSDHTTGATTAVMAVALGSAIFEKHLTLNTSLPGPDHAASLDVAAFTAYVAAIHEAYAALGSRDKTVSNVELDVRRVARRSLVLTESLPRGTLLELSHLNAKRPADGLSPMRLDQIVGRRLARDVRVDVALQQDDLEPI